MRPFAREITPVMFPSLPAGDFQLVAPSCIEWDIDSSELETTDASLDASDTLIVTSKVPLLVLNASKSNFTLYK